MDIAQFIHLAPTGHLGPNIGNILLAVKNEAAVNLFTQGFVWTYTFITLGKNRLGLLGHMVWWAAFWPP